MSTRLRHYGVRTGLLTLLNISSTYLLIHFVQVLIYFLGVVKQNPMIRLFRFLFEFMMMNSQLFAVLLLVMLGFIAPTSAPTAVMRTNDCASVPVSGHTQSTVGTVTHWYLNRTSGPLVADFIFVPTFSLLHTTATADDFYPLSILTFLLPDEYAIDWWHLPFSCHGIYYVDWWKFLARLAFSPISTCCFASLIFLFGCLSPLSAPIVGVSQGDDFLDSFVRDNLPSFTHTVERLRSHSWFIVHLTLHSPFFQPTHLYFKSRQSYSDANAKAIKGMAFRFGLSHTVSQAGLHTLLGLDDSYSNQVINDFLIFASGYYLAQSKAAKAHAVISFINMRAKDLTRAGITVDNIQAAISQIFRAPTLPDVSHRVLLEDQFSSSTGYQFHRFFDEDVDAALNDCNIKGYVSQSGVMDTMKCIFHGVTGGSPVSSMLKLITLFWVVIFATRSGKIDFGLIQTLEEKLIAPTSIESVANLGKVVISHLTSLCSAGHEFYTTRDPMVFVRSEEDATKFIDQALRVISAFASYRFELRLTPASQQLGQDIDSTLALGHQVLRYARASQRPLILQYIAKLTNTRMDFQTANRSKSMRDAPFSLLVHSTPGIGKSSIVDLITSTFRVVNPQDAITQPDRVSATALPLDGVYARTSEDFWSQWKNTNWCIIYDDLGQKNPAVPGFQTEIQELIHIVNNVAYFPPMAGVDEKGKATALPSLVIATTNNLDINATFAVRTPAAVLRRFPFVVKPRVKGQYLTNNMLDSSKVPTGDTDLWFFDIDRVVLTAPASGAAGVVYQSVAQDLSTADFARWIKTASLQHFDVQQKCGAFKTTLLADSRCTNCGMPCAFCNCGSRVVAPVTDRVVGASQGIFYPDVYLSASNFTLVAFFLGLCTFTFSLCLYFYRRLISHIDNVIVACIRSADVISHDNIREPVHQGVGAIHALREELVGIQSFWTRLLFPYTFVRDKTVAFCSYLPTVRFPVLYIFPLYFYHLFHIGFNTFIVFYAYCFSYVGLVGPGFVSRRFVSLSTSILESPFISFLVMTFSGGDSLGTWLYNRCRAYSRPKFICLLLAVLSGAAVLYFASRLFTGSSQGSIPSKCAEGASLPTGPRTENVWTRSGMMNWHRVLPEVSRTSNPDGFSDHLKSAMATISVRNGSVTGANKIIGINICGSYWLIPKHWMQPALGLGKDYKIVVQRNYGNFGCHISPLIPERWFPHPTEDYGVYRVSCPPGHDLRKYILASPLTAPFSASVLLMREELEVAHSNGPIDFLNSSIPDLAATLGSKYVVRQRYVTPLSTPTRSGDCGSPLFSSEKGKCFLAGIHVGADIHTRKTLSIPLDFKWFQSLSAGVSEGPFALSTSVKKHTLTDLHPKSPIRFEGLGDRECDVKIYGSLDVLQHRFISAVARNKFASFWEQRGHSTSKVAPRGFPLWLPKRNFLLNATALKEVADDSILQQCFTHFSNKLSGLCTDRIKVLSHDNTLYGVEGDNFVNAINWSAGSGFPWNKAKNLLLPQSEGKYVFTDEISQRIDDMVSNILSGSRANMVFNASLKDEPISEKKLLAGKIRVFMACPLEGLYLVRKYFLSILASLQAENFVSEMAVGLNCYSADWDGLYDYSHPKGWKVFCGDYTNFDQYMSAQFTRAAWSLMIEIARRSGFSPEDICIMEGLSVECIFPNVNFFGDLLTLTGTNPSGHPLTVVTNGLVNSLYIRYAWVVIFGDLRDFEDNVRIMTYGDDNTVSVSPVYQSRFNQQTVREALETIGVVYTDSKKDGTKVEFVADGEESFLKRRWVKGPGFWFCPLERDSISKMLIIGVQSGNVDENDRLASVLISSVLEAFHHGREFFEKHSQDVRDCAVEYNLEGWLKSKGGLPTWDIMLEQRVNGNYSVQYIGLPYKARVDAYRRHQEAYAIELGSSDPNHAAHALQLPCQSNYCSVSGSVDGQGVQVPEANPQNAL